MMRQKDQHLPNHRDALDTASLQDRLGQRMCMPGENSNIHTNLSQSQHHVRLRIVQNNFLKEIQEVVGEETYTP